MPLSSAAPRELMHTRQIECRGYLRQDGLWDIEGHLVDSKPYSLPGEMGRDIAAGEPVHDMWLRVTIDDDMVIRACEAATEASPFEACGEIVPNYEKLVGIRIGSGWMKAVNDRIGGVLGCTHLRELLRPIATTAYQTIYTARIKQAREKGLPRPRPHAGRPRHLNACYAYREDGPLVAATFPEHYTGPAPSTLASEGVKVRRLSACTGPSSSSRKRS